MKEFFDKTVKNTSETSEKLFEKFRLQKFENLFRKFDSDQDGKISFQNICLDNVDPKILRLLAPIFDELEQNGESELVLDEFIERIEAVYAKCTKYDKMILVKNDNSVEPEQHSFVPKINKNSGKLAAGTLHLGKDLYERSKAAQQIKELKLKKARELKESALDKK